MLAETIERLQNGKMRVSLFIDPDPSACRPLAAEVGADRVEFYTGPYGDPHSDTTAELARLVATAAACRRAGLRAARGGAGLGMNAGHDLTLDNLPALIKAIPDLDECSIGHALTADALKVGFPEAVRHYMRALSGPGLPSAERPDRSRFSNDAAHLCDCGRGPESAKHQIWPQTLPGACAQKCALPTDL